MNNIKGAECSPAAVISRHCSSRTTHRVDVDLGTDGIPWFPGVDWQGCRTLQAEKDDWESRKCGFDSGNMMMKTSQMANRQYEI